MTLDEVKSELAKITATISDEQKSTINPIIETVISGISTLGSDKHELLKEVMKKKRLLLRCLASFLKIPMCPK